MKYICYIFLSLVFVVGAIAKSGPVPDDDQKITIVWDDNKNDKAWLGVQIKDLTRKLRQELDSKARYGVVIDEVVDNSPADEAGLEPGDVILKVDNKSVKKVKELLDELSKRKPEDEIKLEIMRGRDRMDITVILGNRSKREIVIGNPLKGFRMPSFSPGAYIGVEVQSMDEHLADYFNVNEDEGVLVTHVDGDGPAEQAGIRSGDVIIAIEGEEVTDTESITDILSDYKKGDNVGIEFIRKGRKESAVLVLEEKPFSFESLTFPKPPAPNSPSFYWGEDNERSENRWEQFEKDELRDELSKEREEYQQEMKELRRELKEMREEMKELRKNRE